MIAPRFERSVAAQIEAPYLGLSLSCSLLVSSTCDYSTIGNSLRMKAEKKVLQVDVKQTRAWIPSREAQTNRMSSGHKEMDN